MTLEPIDGASRVTEHDEIRRLLRYLRPYVPGLASGVVLIAVMGVIEFLVAFALRPAFDVILNPHSTSQALTLFQIPGTNRVLDLHSFAPRHFHNVMNVFGVALVLMTIVKGVSEYIGSILIQHVGLSAVTDIRNEVYSQVVQQPIGFFQHNPVGRVMSAVIADIEQMRNAFSDWFAEFFRQIFALIAFIAVLLVINWRMAFGAAILIPLVVWPVSKFGRKIRRSSEKSRSRLADLSQILQETIAGNRVVKAFGMEGFEIRKFREAARNLLHENMRWIRAFAATSPLMDLLGAVVVVLVLLFARGEIKAGRMTRRAVRLVCVCAFQSLRAHQAPRQRVSALPAGRRNLQAGIRVHRSCRGKSWTRPKPKRCRLFRVPSNSIAQASPTIVTARSS